MVDKEVSPVYQVSKILWDMDKKGKTVVFKKISNTLIESVGNVINTRSKLYYALNVSNDEEAYKKILEALTSKPEFKEEAFDLKTIELDLTRLPAVKFYEKDGGRYITSSIVIACLDENNCNASIHRIMVLGKDKATIRIVPRHLYYIYNENLKKGKDTPIAIVIGVHPALMIASALSPPFGVFEIGLASKLLSKKVRIAYTPKYNLPIPYGAEVVLEGKLTSKLVNEGPFVDITLTYDKIRKQPLIIIDSIYVNTNPLFHIILPGGREHQLLMGFPREAMIWETVRRVVPKVVKVRLTPGGGGWLHAVISIEKNVDGDAKNAILAALAAHPSLKHVIVVDNDIDPDNPLEVEWAIATRFQAHKDLVIITHVRGSTLDPSAEDGLTSKMGIDATKPVGDEKYNKPRIPYNTE